MEREQRGILLVDREDTEKAILRLQNELKRLGQNLVEFGNKLVTDPSRVVFSNAPSGLGNVPMSLMHIPGIDWNSIPDKNAIAPKIQELRKLQEKLSNITMQLGG